MDLSGLGEGILNALKVIHQGRQISAEEAYKQAQALELKNKIEMINDLKSGKLNLYQQQTVPGQQAAIPPTPVNIKPGQQAAKQPEEDIQPSQYIAGLTGDAWKNLHPEVKKNLNAFSKEFYDAYGRPFSVTDGWRSYETQADLYRRKPQLAAKPGTSRHELGEALDAHTQDAEDAHKLGLFGKYPMFHRPMAVRQPGKKYEPWHIELLRS